MAFTDEQKDKLNEAILGGAFGFKEGQTMGPNGVAVPFRRVDSSIFSIVRKMDDNDVLTKVSAYFVDKKLNLLQQASKKDAERAAIQEQIDGIKS